MTKIQHPNFQGPPDRDPHERKKKKRHKELLISPCGRPPKVVTGSRVVFAVRETKEELEYTTLVKWNEVDEDLHGFPIRAAAYYVQMRATDSDGDPIRWKDPPSGDDQILDETPNERYIIVYTRTVDKPNDDDDGFTSMVSFGKTLRPRKWYWQCRVKVEDREGCKSDWSDWSDHVSPQNGRYTSPRPPTPTSITLDFDTVRAGRGSTWAAISTADEVGHWDIPGYDEQDDVSLYTAELQESDDADGDTWTQKGDRKTWPARDDDSDTTAQVMWTRHIRKHRYYRVRWRTVDRFNRRGAWSEWSVPGSPSDVTPPPPLNVVAYGRHNHVGVEYDVPRDPDDTDLVDLGVSYFQVQLASSSSFSASTILKFDRYVRGEKREWETTRYRRRYWLRARAIDGSGNKGNWVTAGPVRPQKVGGQKVLSPATSTEAEVDFGNAGNLMVGGGLNRARINGPTGTSSALVSGESRDGTLIGVVETGETSDAVVIGFAFAGVSQGTYLGIRVKDATGINRMELFKSASGAITVLDTSSGLTVANDRTYELRATITGTEVVGYVDGIEYVRHTLTGGDETTYAAGALVGLHTAPPENGQSRWESWRFTPSGSTVPSVDDVFARTPNTTIGVADSGQTYAQNADFEVADDETEDALFGWQMIMPRFSQAYSNDVTSGFPDVGFKRVGATENNTPVQIEVDQPTRFFIDAVANVTNMEASAFDVSMYIVCTVAGSHFGGTGMTEQIGASTKRHIHNMRDFFVAATTNSPVVVSFWWGFGNSTADSQSLKIGNRKMQIEANYAPDYASGAGTRPKWTKSQITKQAYRNVEPD